MKAEDKILELIADYLKKTDQTLERMDFAYDVLMKHSEELMKHSEELIELRKSSVKNQEEITSLRKDSMKHQIQQDVLLKEIMSIHAE